MFCYQCGKKIADNSKFCRYCGSAVDEVEETEETDDIQTEPETISGNDIDEEKSSDDEGLEEYAPAITCAVEGQTIAFSSRYQEWQTLVHDHLLMTEELYQEFQQWYYDNLDALIKKDTFFDQVLTESRKRIDCLVQWAVKEMTHRGYYYLSHTRFFEEYGDQIDLEQYLTPIYDQYAEIICTEQQLAAYQQAKKESRGHWQGGGFGIGGAIKGAITASAMNLGSSMFHSVFDSISASGDRRKIQRMKSDLFRRKATGQAIFKGFASCCGMIFRIVSAELTDADLIEPQPLFGDKASAVLENAATFQNERGQYIRMLLESIVLYPMRLKPYEILIQYLGYPHYEVCKLAEYWGLENAINRTVESCYQYMFQKQLQLPEETLEEIRAKRAALLEQEPQFEQSENGHSLYYHAEEYRQKILIQNIDRLDEAEHKILYTVDGYTFQNEAEMTRYMEERERFNRFAYGWNRCDPVNPYEERLTLLLQLLHTDIQTPFLWSKIVRYIPPLLESEQTYLMYLDVKEKRILQDNYERVYQLIRNQQLIAVREIMEKRKNELDPDRLARYQIRIAKAHEIMSKGCTAPELKEVLQYGLSDRVPEIELLYGSYALERVERHPSESDLYYPLHLLYDSAVAGNVDAQFALARAHATQFRASGPEVMRFWLSTAAEAGHVKAQTRLAYYFVEGKILPQNGAVAEYWLKKAIPSGDPEAEFCYGIALSSGVIPSKDATKGLWYIKRAALNGYQTAITYLEQRNIPLLTCPQCNNPISREDKFCGKCGFKLET